MAQGDCKLASALTFLTDTTSKSIKLCSCCAFNIFRLSHMLKTCSANPSTGYWMNSFTSTYFAAFSAEIIAALVGGSSVVEAAFAPCPCSFFVIW
jgi:hypothetical protein